MKDNNLVLKVLKTKTNVTVGPNWIMCLPETHLQQHMYS